MGSRKKLKKRLDALQRQRDRQPQPKVQAQPPSPTGGGKKWLFRLIAVTVIPLLLLATVELSLRFTGYGYPTGAAIEADGMARRNFKFGWRFFPKTISRVSEPFSFPIKKPEGSFRIFVLGGSAAMGTPDPAYAFSRNLNVMLNERYPGMSFEVINMAVTAINSHVVLEIAKDCAGYDPDLFIVYMGNNEVVGPYGAGTVFGTLSPNLTAIRFSIAIKSLKIGQLIENIVASFGRRDAAPLTWEGLRMFLDKKILPDSDDLKQVYGHFEQNLADIIETGIDSGAKVVVSTVSSNLKDSPPFSSQHRADLEDEDLKLWEVDYRAGATLEESGMYEDALRWYMSAAATDDSFADLHFRIARCHEALGEFEEAKRRYVVARELDTLRFRADSTINDIIRSVAGRFGGDGVHFVDSSAALEALSPNGIPGDELFYEHVHFRFRGSYLLARSILDAVEQALSGNGAGPVPSEEECAGRLAYTGWDRHRVAAYVLEGFVKKPPSTDQLYYEQRAGDMEREISEFGAYNQPAGIEESREQYREAIGLWPEDWKLRAKYGDLLRMAVRDHSGAADQWSAVAEMVPHSDAYSMLGMALGMQGKFDEALSYFDRALEMNPISYDAHANLATTLAMKGDNEGAAEHFALAVEINPQISPKVYQDMARALAAIGRNDEAIDALRRSTVFYPDSADLHFFLGVFLAEERRSDEAIEELRTALRLQPDHQLARTALERLGAIKEPAAP
jgi:tetratricopeptide (TPR) repeat protein